MHRTSHARPLPRTAPLAALPFALLVAGACSTAVEPLARTVVPVSGIEMPAAAAAADTVRIRFRYDDSCGERATVEVERAPSAVRVRVTKPTPEHPLPCPKRYVEATDSVIVLPAERGGALTVRFARPNAPDSTRVVAALP